MFRTIVVPLDGSGLSEGALRPAAALARRVNAEVLLLHVAPPANGHFWSDEYVGRVAATVDAPKVSTETVTAEDTAEAIVKTCSDAEGSVVCMAAHGRSGVGYLVMGSTAEAVMRALHRPALIVGPNGGGLGWEFEGGEYGRILVCLDGSELSEQALGPATEWARGLNSELTLVQVSGGNGIPVGEDVLETGYLARVAAKAARAQGVVIEDWDVVHDHHPAAGIIRFAEDRRVSLIAVSTHGRSGLSRVVMGSVAMAVVHTAGCPVLVVPSSEV